jgi:hypothetical protein
MADEQNTIARPSREAYEQSGAAIQRAEAGARSMEQRRGELQSTALAERAKAEIQAMFIVALQRPRNVEEFRRRVLDHCERPGFAMTAEYAKPIGANKVKGPSIRFVETAIQEFGNIRTASPVIYDDDERRTVRVSVMDLERNVSYDDEIVIEKTVERRDRRGYEVLSSRTNKDGDVVHRVRATEDDLRSKQGAMVSKTMRTLGLRVLPADIVAEAMDACRRTRQNRDAQDPDAAQRAIVDHFAPLGVMPRDLDEYLGHPLAASAPAELDDLRVAFATVRDGEARWMELVEARRAERGEMEEPSKAAERGAAAVAKVRERIAAKQSKEHGK